MRQRPYLAGLIAILSSLAVASALPPPLPEPSNTFVRVSPRDHRYLELTDGTPYIPIGLNIVAPPYDEADADEALRTMETWRQTFPQPAEIMFESGLAARFGAWSTIRAATTTSKKPGASIVFWICAASMAFVSS